MSLSPLAPDLANNLLATLKPADAALLTDHLVAQEVQGGEVLLNRARRFGSPTFPAVRRSCRSSSRSTDHTGWRRR